jgi:hypothetical protein
MEEGDGNLPQVYFSNFDFYDTRMKYIRTSPTISQPQSLVRVLVGSQLGVGFTLVFNAAIKGLIDDAAPFDLEIYGHDHWVTLMGLSFGTIVYDPTVTAKHRRHEQNVSNYKINFFELQKERIRDFIINNKQKVITDSLYYFYQLYKDKMKEEDRRKFELFSNRRYSFKKATQKSFFPERYRDKLFDEIAIRILFLIGKM